MSSWKRFFVILALVSMLAFPDIRPVRAQDELPPVDTTADTDIEILAAIVVTSTADTQGNDGACTLREAILNANTDNQSGSTDCAAGNEYDTITFNVSLPATITLNSKLPDITSDVFIQGPGADQLTISGNNTVRIFVVPGNGILQLQGVTLANGRAQVDSGNGGAVYNFGYLTVESCIFTGNSASASGGAIFNDGGEIYIYDSALIMNSSSTGGGAIYNKNNGLLSVVNSTFSGNTTGALGGGAIFNHSPSTLMISFSTFTNNTTTNSNAGGAIGNGGNGTPGGTTVLYYSLLAANLANGTVRNCRNEGGELTDGGYNLENANSCGFSGTSLINTNPLIRELADNGGTTPTHALSRESPAIDRIPAELFECGGTIDQRGVPRPMDGNNDGQYACDVGAYESDDQIGPTFTVNQTGDEGGFCLLSFCTLRQAITSAQLLPASGDYEILFDLPHPSTIVFGSTLPAITHHLTIDGDSPAWVTISGAHAVQLFYVESTGTLDLRSLTLADGHADNGGAVYNLGHLTADDCIFSGNTSNASSGAIFNTSSASALIRGSTFSGNSASSAGGAIGNYDGVILTVLNSTFSGNSTGDWGGGAIYTYGSTSSTELVSNTFVNNTTTNSNAGGAIGNGGAGEDGGSVLLKNNLLAANLANGTIQNCYNYSGSITDGGYNLEDSDTCGFSGTSLINTDPIIRGLESNGGTTPTHALSRESTAIDRIPSGDNGCGTTLTTDQRGATRPLDGDNDALAACDVGAYEADDQTGPTFIVNQTGDEDGFCHLSFCTLRQAITSAQLLPASGDYDIVFDMPDTSTIVLSDILPAVTHHLTIDGNSPAKITISGNHAVQMFRVDSTSTLDLRSLTLADGYADNGGAVYNLGHLTVDDCIFTGNTSEGGGGAVVNQFLGSVAITGSSFISNSSGFAGGAISNNDGATLNVINSTFSGNSTGTWGGGAIYNKYTSSMEIVNSTFFNNTASGNTVGGAIGNGGNGYTGGTTVLKNNLLAANLANGTLQNCYNESGTVTDGGYNLENGNSCGFSGTSLINTDPLIRGLADNGGPTPTHALQASSPAIDRLPAGTNGCGTTLTTDQRGVVRPLDGNEDEVAACDVGAYEFDLQPGPTFTVNQIGDEGGFCQRTSCTLRQAITSAQLLPTGGDYEILFDLPGPSTIVLSDFLPTITHHLTIEGDSPAKITISGNHAVQIFSVNATGSLNLRSLTLANGFVYYEEFDGAIGDHAAQIFTIAPAATLSFRSMPQADPPDKYAGAIDNHGNLTADNCIFTGNTSNMGSGALFNSDGASAVIRNSTFTKNFANDIGGAIVNLSGATMTVMNSTFSGNSAGEYGGGAIFNGESGTLEITSSTFFNNTTTGSNVGGAIGNGGNGYPGGTTVLKNNLLVANLANGALQNCYTLGGSMLDGGYNLENGDTCGFIGTSLINTNPRIRGLADNGGPTPTHALRSGSPAIDRIPAGTNGCGSLVLTDQRGVERPRAGSNNGSYRCDIGAYEVINQVYLPLIAK